MTHAHTPAKAEAAEPAPSRSMPPLAALRCFAVAARSGSFTRAAEELCVTQGAVSRQVLLLEEFYGQPLFLRQARGLALTEAGRQLEETARTAFDQIAQTTRVLRRKLEARELRFMVPTCAMLWAMPLLMRFHKQHPGFRVAVTTTLSHVMDDDVFDAGIVYDRLDDARPHQVLLFAERLTPVCSTRLLQGPNGLQRPRDLVHGVLLHARTDHADWRLWLDAAKLDEIDPGSGLDFETLDMSNTAAAEGYGVALGDCTITRPALDAGRLCAPFDIEVATGYGYFLRWHPAHGERSEVAHLSRLFADALASEAGVASMAMRRV